MIGNCRRLLLIGLMMLGASGFARDATARETLNLDGVWNFATDPGNRGEAEKWYQPTAKLPAMPLPGYAPEADGTIRVPGIWDNQGYGTETDKVRHNFVGKGWYKRQVTIPRSWAGRRAFLVITGISRYSKVWIDDHFLGEHIGYLSIQEYDVTQYAAPGKTATITIQVDSKQRWAIDAMQGASSLADNMDVEWGGIWGHVRLEARADAWLSDLFVQPNVNHSSCSASATLHGKSERADAAKLEVFDQSGRRMAETLAKPDLKYAAGQPVRVEATIPDARLWTPESPTLYTARLSLLKGGDVLDTVESRFGMRQFTIDGPYILLNGKRLMLRGYGDDHIYPEQMSMPSDKELHLRQLRIIKSYGFNHVRHHSTMMPPEYYDACDEVGMITTGEFPIIYHIVLPGVGSKWQKLVPKGTSPAAAHDTYRREWTAVLRQFRNHPSIMGWVMGNELGQYDALPKPQALFADIARKLDPQRFFIDSDGVHPQVHLDPQYDRDTLDFYTIQFNEQSSNPIDSHGKYNYPKPIKPSISHETGNYVTFSRPDLVDQFRHNIKPFWLTDGKTKLKKLGLFEEADSWAEKSERLYTLLHKHNLEALRKNPFLSGYHWWLFQDYWTSSNGIVDHYFRPKSIAQDEVVKFNNDVVLLQDGLQRTYRGKDHLELKLRVSNFSFKRLRGNVRWKITVGERTVAQEQYALTNPVPRGELVEIGKIDLELPEIKSPANVNITIELAANGKQYTNDWPSRLYPTVVHPAELPVPVFADTVYSKQFPGWNIQPVPSKDELSDRAVYLTGWPCDPRIVDALKRGAGVVLTDGAEQLMESCPITFRTSWWRAGEKPWDDKNHTGTFTYDHPVTRAVAPDGWCDDGWFHLIEGSNKFNLESKPTRPEVIIRALPGMLVVKDYALLFEVGVGKGTLLVSGLNHRRAKGRPENEWIIARLLEHAARFQQPKAKWPASIFPRVVSVAPDGCIPGFRRLVANEGEDGIWHSFREDNTRVLVCRQTKPGNRIAWETAPVPDKQASERVTFVFAGGMGFNSELKTAGFALDLNGKEVIRFDLPEPKAWQSADKRVKLRFDVLRDMTVDQFGLFHLTVPRDMLKPGKPCVVSVRSLGTGSQRWFGLNPYW